MNIGNITQLDHNTEPITTSNDDDWQQHYNILQLGLI